MQEELLKKSVDCADLVLSDWRRVCLLSLLLKCRWWLKVSLFWCLLSFIIRRLAGIWFQPSDKFCPHPLIAGCYEAQHNGVLKDTTLNKFLEFSSLGASLLFSCSNKYLNLKKIVNQKINFRAIPKDVQTCFPRPILKFCLNCHELPKKKKSH